VSENGSGATEEAPAAQTDAPVAEVATKPGRHREASLYHALAGAGA
jgi:hypothetical protein